MKSRRPPRDPLVAVAGLLGLWVTVELLHSSRWLEIGDILARTGSPAAVVPATEPGRTTAPPRALPPLRELLLGAGDSGPAPRRPRVWFAPYTTFPETGILESRARRGVYDTFLAFPPTGITSNYGAFKLSPADSAFAQAASGGLPQEAALARRLDYRWFAVDLGAIADPAGLQRLCARTSGCRQSGDGYVLFRLDRAPQEWERALAAQPRNLPELPQLSAGQRWGSLVFEPGHWWPPAGPAGKGAPVSAPAGRRSVGIRPLWSAGIFRYAPDQIPPALRARLTPPGERIWVRLAPGLAGAELCLQAVTPHRWIGGGTPCRRIVLRRQTPRVELTRALAPGRVTRLTIEWLYGPDGLPITPERLPIPAGPEPQPSAFAVEIDNPSIPAGPLRAQALREGVPVAGGAAPALASPPGVVPAGTPVAPRENPP